jgi:hypothetical protein
MYSEGGDLVLSYTEVLSIGVTNLMRDGGVLGLSVE